MLLLHSCLFFFFFGCYVISSSMLLLSFCTHLYQLTHTPLVYRKHHFEYLHNPEAISLNSGRHRYSQQGRRKSDKELLFGTKKKTTSSPQASDSDSPVRTPQEILNAADATQKDSLPSNEVVNFQLEWFKNLIKIKTDLRIERREDVILGGWR